MSQNILLLIRADIKAVDDKVTALQTTVAEISSNLPDVTEITELLETQSATLAGIQATVDNINTVLNPELPEQVPDNVPLQTTATAFVKKSKTSK